MIKLLLLSLAAASVISAGSIKDVEHIVVFMQENRAFDHYWGTMAGVRGYKDPNVATSNGKSVFYQMVNSSMSTKTDHLLPFYLNEHGGKWLEATQCMEAGSNGWQENQGALNGDLNNHWAMSNTPFSWGYYKRSDLPNHFAIAEGWTVGDMYQESVIASTNPNRVSWISGSINAPGSPQSPDEGGMYIDNNESPTCEEPHLNFYPLEWQTAPEIYENAGISWQLYQDYNNFDDNPLAFFKQFQKAKNSTALHKKGMAAVGLEKFYKDAADGNLPEISYIVGPAELSEHPPYQPRDGAWLQQKVVDVVTSSPLYNKTVLIISYDETGGWGDHVVPFHSPPGTAGEWAEDPYSNLGQVYTDPGYRLPFYVVSPWTRGGNVYVENADHSSQIKFIEQVYAAKGKNMVTNQIPAWRREHMADLTKAFDFEHPDYSIPPMPNVSYLSRDKTGLWNGWSLCQEEYLVRRPPVPYGKQTEATSLVTEDGFKGVRGQLTEGRFLVFEMNGFAIASCSGALTTSKATSKHNIKSQRFVISGCANKFKLKGFDGKARSSGAEYTIMDMGNGQDYSIKNSSGQYLSINQQGKLVMEDMPKGSAIFSVTYND